MKKMFSPTDTRISLPIVVGKEENGVGLIAHCRILQRKAKLKKRWRKHAGLD